MSRFRAGAQTERGTFIKRLDSGCWQWQGRLDANGVPIVSVNWKRWTARRWYWVGATGEYPSGKLVDLCGNDLCVRPAHMNKAHAAGIPDAIIPLTPAQRQAAWRKSRM